MDWTINKFGNIGMQLILPFFEGISKAPNKSLDGLNRKQRSLIRSAVSSKDFEGKRGQRLSVWTEECRVLLIGMGEKEKFTRKLIRNTGARTIAVLSKKKGVDITVRFTSGWNVENMLLFAEGMMLRDYSFDNHKMADKDGCLDSWNVDFQSTNRYQQSLEKGLQRLDALA